MSVQRLALVTLCALALRVFAGPSPSPSPSPAPPTSPAPTSTPTPSPSPNSSQVQFTNLYDANAFISGFLIPFQLGGTLISAGGIVQQFSVSTDNGANCQMMEDPFHPLIFLLKCASSSNVTLHFIIESQGDEKYPADYGPLAITSSSGVSVGSGDGGVTAGQAYFNNICAQCHGINNVGVPGTASPITTQPSAQTIITTINTEGGIMTSTLQPELQNGTLTVDQISAISSYLQQNP